MQRTRWIVAAALFISGVVAAAEPAVSARSGNIYFTDAGGVERQLTSSGQDSAPILSPDGRYVVFVRAIKGEKIDTGSEERDPSELWQVRTDGREPTRFLRTRADAAPEKVIAGFDNLRFSTNGRLVYFVTPAWTTSGAVHVVDTTNGKERFVMAGNELEVVPMGEYRDHLLVSQHRYFVGGGSYDWFWLFRPDGKEVGPVGEDTENFKSLYFK